MGRGASPQKAFHSLAMWRHALAHCILRDGTILTRNNTLSFGITQTCLDSPNLLQLHSILFRFTQSCLDPVRFTLSHSDSQSFASSQVQITCRLSQVHSFSLRFTQTYSDFLRFVHSQIQSHQIQISSDPLRFTTRSRPDLLRLTQIYPYWFNATLISLDLLSLIQIQINSDTLRSTHSRSDSLRRTQIYSDWFNVI